MALPNNPNHPHYKGRPLLPLKVSAARPTRSKKTSLPDNLARLPIDVLDLSVRSHNALVSNRTKQVEDLLNLSDEELLKIRNLGRKSLTDIHDALHKFISAHAAKVESGDNTEQPAANDLDMDSSETSTPEFSSGGWRIPRQIALKKYGLLQVTVDEVLTAPVEVLDLSTRPLNAMNRLNIASVGELLEFPKQRLSQTENMGRRSINEIQSNLFAYLSGDRVSNENSGHGHDADQLLIGTKAFVEKMLALLPDRQRSIIADRYGLWDGIAETLQDIGDKLGLTRERIRQIEEKGLRRLRRIYGYGAIKHFALAKIAAYVTSQGDKTCGVLSDDEVADAFADDCPSDEAMLAVNVLQDINASLFAKHLFEAEPGVYCLDKAEVANYKPILEAVQRMFKDRQKPIPEATLCAQLIAAVPLTENREPLVRRLLEVSPSLVRLRNGSVGLSDWTEFGRRDAKSLTEAALHLLGRPAHFKEIAKSIGTFFPDAGPANERTIHQVLLGDQQTFVWVGNGTYGLSAWGLKRPPFIKDRLIALLSDSSYPLSYWHLSDKVLEVCNCKETSVRMTLDLNPRVFRKFEGDQYGLQKHYE